MSLFLLPFGGVVGIFESFIIVLFSDFDYTA